MADYAKGLKHQKEYIYDFSVDGGTQGTINLSDKIAVNTSGGAGPTMVGDMPDGAIVTNVFTVTEVAVTSGGSPTFDLGTTDDPNGYLAAVTLAAVTAQFAVAGNSGVATVQPQANDVASADMLLAINTADVTAGRIRFVIEFYIPTFGLS